uniref:Large ribosomal subunit protein uL13c n=1 Tax=Cliftonaea pectinata TaxID=2007206 RepID=A0A1Z1MPS9_9FLOR|nr:ribosomal protein L13 [Cliftonaea pectinata]ARW68097.1 ribosomal protein L13 [Cliftonaea pectinata]
MYINKNKTSIKCSKDNTDWYIIDAKDKNLGRLSSIIAYLLKGKNSVEYIPHKKSKTKIIIINSRYIKVTGNKILQKTYKRHSGRPGGLKTENFNQLKERIPNRIIEHAVKGMLPKNSLGRQLFRNLKVYSNNEHPHISQKPKILEVKNYKK